MDETRRYNRTSYFRHHKNGTTWWWNGCRWPVRDGVRGGSPEGRRCFDHAWLHKGKHERYRYGDWWTNSRSDQGRKIVNFNPISRPAKIVATLTTILSYFFEARFASRDLTTSKTSITFGSRNGLPWPCAKASSPPASITNTSDFCIVPMKEESRPYRW